MRPIDVVDRDFMKALMNLKQGDRKDTPMFSSRYTRLALIYTLGLVAWLGLGPLLASSPSS